MFKSLRNVLVGGLGAFFIRLIGATLRMTVQDESRLLSNPHSSTPVIFAFWHNRMFLMPYLYRRYLSPRHVICLVSSSQDGEMIARVLCRFRMGVARGSSSRRGKEAYRELAEHLKTGNDVAITPDGPRGPRYSAHTGVVGLASFSGFPLIPVSYRLEWKIELPTWDRFIIPVPFSPCHLHLGKEMLLDDLQPDEVLEKSRGELERKLIQMGEEVGNAKCEVRN